jgi:hypothetical protein
MRFRQETETVKKERRKEREGGKKKRARVRKRERMDNRTESVGKIHCSYRDIYK